MGCNDGGRDGRGIMSVVIKELTHIYSIGTPYQMTAISDISTEIQDGEFVCIIGHTGSGKSTLIQHINGLIKPTSGTLVVEGVDMATAKSELRQLRMRVGLVFQYPEQQLFEETVEKDVAFGPKNMGLPPEEIKARVEYSLKLMHLDPEEIGKSSPFDLSGGQRRRVAIAGVLAMKPSVLILDEPSAGMDPQARRSLREIFRGIHREAGCTILMVSHSMDEVAMVADRVIVLDKGRLVMDGTPEEIFSHGDALRKMNLAVPTMTQVAEGLRLKGVDCPLPMLTVEDMSAWLLSRIGEGRQ